MSFPPDFSPDLLVRAAELHVLSEDIEETFTRGSGKGGQRRNKRSTCVMLRHIPTGISVRCDDERDQYQNRLRAYAHLLEKIQTLVEERNAAEAQEKFLARKHHARRPRGIQERILREKKQRGETKKTRRKIV
ncbi:peptide chain release factor-like protein [Candidatus Peregrinibacteria bacterium]|nr:peptide chain release factor-like protein [Candidatus Peregrinibacteria bacterium]